MPDAFELATREPKKLRAGDTWAWSRPDLAETYAPAEFRVTYDLIRAGAGGGRLALEAIDEGGAFVVRRAAADTAEIAAGSWRWILRLTRLSDGAVQSLCEGHIEILTDPTLGADPRSQAEIALAQIDQVLADRTSKDVQSYAIEGRNLVKMTVADLTALRRHFQRIVRGEQAAARGRGGALLNPRPLRVVIR